MKRLPKIHIVITLLFLLLSASKILAQNIDTAFTGGERFEENFGDEEEEQARIAQNMAVNSISTPTIIPANPTTADIVKTKYNIHFPSQPAFQLSVTAVGVSGSVVTIEEHYEPGAFLTPTTVVNTTTIGILPAGNYKLVCNIHKYALTAWESPTSYTYTETDIDKDSILFTVTGSLVAVIENENLLQSLSMRPNPATNKLTISSDKNINDLQIQIVNLTGENVLSTNCKSNCEIDISQLPEGVYFVNIYQKEKFVGVKKLVVMR